MGYCLFRLASDQSALHTPVLRNNSISPTAPRPRFEFGTSQRYWQMAVGRLTLVFSSRCLVRRTTATEIVLLVLLAFGSAWTV